MVRAYCSYLTTSLADALAERGLSPAADHPFAAVMLVVIGMIVRRLRELGGGRPGAVKEPGLHRMNVLTKVAESLGFPNPAALERSR